MIEVQDVFKQYGSEYIQNHILSKAQSRAFQDILHCRTAAFGGHVNICDECGHKVISYNSCRNRHCPKCQTIKKEQWIENQEQYLLNIRYFHVVFTIPDDLNPLMYQNQKELYKIFFKAVSETLLELGRNKKYLGAKLGITTILHTWGQNLSYHPHIHCVIPGGGLTDDGRWVHSRKKFFIPVKVLSKKFRGKFLALLRQAELEFHGSIKELSIPSNFDLFISALYQKAWVTYCKPPFGNASKVVAYLGRYTHRVAISNNRILKLENGCVTFKWRDYRDNKLKEMSVTAEEFIRRFLMHILPSRFSKIRHYGILASKDKATRITLCKKLTNTPVYSVDAPRNPLDIIRELLGDKFDLCPRCGIGHLIEISSFKSSSLTRASPVQATV